MKITNEITSRIIPHIQDTAGQVKQAVKFEPVQDVFVRRINPDLPVGNILTAEKNSYGELMFKDGGKEVGISTFDIVEDNYGNPELYPQNWFEPDVTPKFDGKRYMKPYMFVHELVMFDRIGEKELVSRGKKYGTMAIQHLLNIANKNDCEGRIVLNASKLGKTGFAPGSFYHKMGFSLPVKTTKNLEMQEQEYIENLAKLLERGMSEANAKELLESRGFRLPEKKDGRYIVDTGYMILTNPECAMNYPLK